MQRKTFDDFLKHLASGIPLPIPAPSLVHQTACDLAEGQTQEIDANAFDFFLDVLPPRAMGRGWFAFAEGIEPFRFFWKRSGRYFCRRLTWDETTEFLRLAKGGACASS